MNPEQNLMASEVSESAVSWSAVFAGAAAAAALSLLLLMLGTGLGLSSVSPWTMEGVTAATFGVGTILWVTLTQFLASGMGGYLAGRLRSKWDDVHTDEVHFRDTAHGFLAWAVATLAMAALLTTAVSAIVGGGVKTASALTGSAAAGATAVAGVATDSDQVGSMNYFIDSMLRKPSAWTGASTVSPDVMPAAGPVEAAVPADSDPRHAQAAKPPAGTNAETSISPQQAGEAARIMLHAMQADGLSQDDTRYLGQLIAERSGLSQQEAEKKVGDTFAQLQASTEAARKTAQEAADSARKASAYAALWLFISLQIGAFIASLAALFGGRHRIA